MDSPPIFTGESICFFTNNNYLCKRKTGCSSARLEYTSGGRVVVRSNRITPTAEHKGLTGYCEAFFYLANYTPLPNLGNITNPSKHITRQTHVYRATDSDMINILISEIIIEKGYLDLTFITILMGLARTLRCKYIAFSGIENRFCKNMYV